jgi:hypothetical protein
MYYENDSNSVWILHMGYTFSYQRVPRDALPAGAGTLLGDRKMMNVEKYRL